MTPQDELRLQDLRNLTKVFGGNVVLTTTVDDIVFLLRLLDQTKEQQPSGEQTGVLREALQDLYDESNFVTCEECNHRQCNTKRFVIAQAQKALASPAPAPTDEQLLELLHYWLPGCLDEKQLAVQAIQRLLAGTEKP